MPEIGNQHAVVIGCGIAGIAAAAALRPHFRTITIVEKDQLSEATEARQGVAQGAQLHNLLTPAQLHLEILLPGFTAELIKAGAVQVHVSSQTNVYELQRWLPKRDLGLQVICAARPVIELASRRLCLQAPHIRLLDNTVVHGLLMTDAARVEGVADR